MGKQVGKFIRKKRERFGLSQKDLANILRVKTAQSVSNIERGISPLPIRHMKVLARVFRVSQKRFISIACDELRARCRRASASI